MTLQTESEIQSDQGHSLTILNFLGGGNAGRVYEVRDERDGKVRGPLDLEIVSPRDARGIAPTQRAMWLFCACPVGQVVDPDAVAGTQSYALKMITPVSYRQMPSMQLARCGILSKVSAAASARKRSIFEY